MRVTTLFTIADDIVRLRERVIRLKDPNCHAEFSAVATRRLIGNVRITGVDGDTISRRRISSFTAIATTICCAFSSGNSATSSSGRVAG